MGSKRFGHIASCRTILSAKHCHGFKKIFFFFKQENRKEILSVTEMSVGEREILTTTNRKDNIKVASICPVKFQREIGVVIKIRQFMYTCQNIFPVNCKLAPKFLTSLARKLLKRELHCVLKS